MEFYLALLISLHIITFIRVARGQDSLSRSTVCQNTSSSTQCSPQTHTLTCSDNSPIFLLRAENGFGFSPLSSCAGGVCDPQCCSRQNFLCPDDMTNTNFSSYYSNCWGRPSCTTVAAFDSRTFTDGNQNCSGTAALASVSYQCINNSSVVRFDDMMSVSGTAVVARFLNSETNTSSCEGAQNTLKCDVSLRGAGSTEDVRVMLVVEHPQLHSNCSMLSIAEHGITTGNQSCRGSLISYAAENITFPGSFANLSVELTLQAGNHPTKAWAVLTSSNTSLTMQCGKGTCTPSTVLPINSTLSTSTSAATTSSQTATTAPATESTTTTSSSSPQTSDPMGVSNSSTSPGSSMDDSTSSTAVSSSSPGTALSSTGRSATSSHSDSSTLTTPEGDADEPSNAGAIAGGVVGGAIAIVLAIVVIVVCCRRRSSAKEFHDSDDGKVNPVALDDIKLEPESRPPSAYEEVDDPVPGHRKVSYSSIRFEDEAPPPADDSESDYDHLHQRRPSSKPDDTYGRLDEVEADDDPDYSYDHLGGSTKRGTPDPEAAQDDPYSHLHALGTTPDAEPGDVAGSADDVTKDVTDDVTKDVTADDVTTDVTAGVTADDVTADGTADVTADDVTEDVTPDDVTTDVTADVTADVNTANSFVSDSRL